MSMKRLSSILGSVTLALVGWLLLTNVRAQPTRECIVFISGRNKTGNGAQIHVMDAEGTHVRRVTGTPLGKGHPVWLPSGQQIGFSASDNAWGKLLYTVTLDGERYRNLIAHNREHHDRRPVWSPDGHKIAFESGRDGNDEIYVMDADGRNQTNLTNHRADDDAPSWSPDGHKIAFDSNRNGNGNTEIYVMDANGSNVWNLSRNPAHDVEPAWSPDGRKIAFASLRDGQYEVYVMDADGHNQTNLTNHQGHDSLPSWSPDGRKIVFESTRDGGNREIYVMDADGGNPRNLTQHPAEDSEPSWYNSNLAVTPLRKKPSLWGWLKQ